MHVSIFQVQPTFFKSGDLQILTSYYLHFQITEEQNASGKIDTMVKKSNGDKVN